jgi:HlyD family secretion protein
MTRHHENTDHQMHSTIRSRPIVHAAIAILVAVAGCKKSQATTLAIPTAPVERRDIVANAEATGTVEPINIVEVKSKASGLITAMPVDIGTVVSAGQLLVQIDTRDVKNQYDQTVAAMQAAQTSLSVAAAQKKRSDELFAQEVITPQEHETAALAYANAQSQLVKARTDVDLARQRLEDATVRAPIAGTIIAKPVSLGQVITSATSGPTGGTTILQMADLSKVRMRAMVNETDVGNVKPGQVAAVVVDAFPNSRFQGVVEKVEPQAVVQQSVTMFPVLISLDNRDGRLLPGMNGEVTMTVQDRKNVLAIPSDAVRAMKDVAVSSRALGLDPDSVQAQLQAQVAARRAQYAQRDSTGQGRPGAVGADAPQSVTLGSAGQRGSRAGRSGAGAAGRAGGAGAGAGAGGGGGGGFGGAAGAGGGSGRSGGQIVFVKDSGGYSPRIVRLGVTNYDYTEVLSGLKEGEQVALLASANLQQQRTDQQSRIRSATSTPLTGGTGGGAGGRRGGG